MQSYYNNTAGEEMRQMSRFLHSNRRLIRREYDGCQDGEIGERIHERQVSKGFSEQTKPARLTFR